MFKQRLLSLKGLTAAAAPLFSTDTAKLQTCQPTVCVLFNAREATNQLVPTADIRELGERINVFYWSGRLTDGSLDQLE